MALFLLFLFLLMSTTMTGCGHQITSDITFEQALTTAEEVSYAEFMRLATNGEVDTIYYHTDKEYMVFTLYNEESRRMTYDNKKQYEYDIAYFRKTQYPSGENFRNQMLSMGCNLVLMRDYGKMAMTIFGGVLPVIMTSLLLIWWIGMSKNIGGKVDNNIVKKSNTTFEDIIGHDELINEVKFIAKLMKDKSYGESMGIKAPKGLLLTGPPGTGKTSIAKAIASESGLPMIATSGADFKELFVGNGARRIRELFKAARQNAPIILFIDELDAVGEKRDAHGNSSEDTQTINALLKEMDGFKENTRIFVLAATNYPDKLDSALTRAGRFDREIVVNPPKDWKVRKKLFEHYLAKKTVSDDIDIDTIARVTKDFTGADIEMICNEAGIVALMNGKDKIDHDSIEEAIDKKIFNGNRSKEETNPEDRKIVAYHEAGHAVMSILCGLPVSRASIAATTSGVGGAVFREDSDSMFTTFDDMVKQVMVAYAGRASEQIKFTTVTTGAASDINQASFIIYQMIDRYGFDWDKSGLIDIKVFSNYIDNDTVSRVREISVDIYKKTLKELEDNYSIVTALAERLLEVGSMTGKEIMEYVNSAKTQN